jgi:hypothetical protein
MAYNPDDKLSGFRNEPGLTHSQTTETKP